MAHRDARDLLQLLAYAAPVDAAHDDGKVFVVGLLVKELYKYLPCGHRRAFRFAAPPMRSRVGVVESLDATPSKGADFYCFAGH